MSIAQSMLWEESPEGHLGDLLKAVRSLRSSCHYSGMKHACRSVDQGTWLTRLQAPASMARTYSDRDLILHCCCGMHAQKSRLKTVQAYATQTCRVRKLGTTSVLSCHFLPHFDHLLHTTPMRVVVHLPAHSVRHLMLVSEDTAERVVVTTSCAKDMLTH